MGDMNDISTEELRRELQQRDDFEAGVRSKLRRELVKDFEATHDLRIYEASDYCGLDCGQYEFYYGYEVTTGDDEWCFIVRYRGELRLTIPKGELYAVEVPILWYLLSGIGQWLQLNDVMKSFEGGDE